MNKMPNKHSVCQLEVSLKALKKLRKLGLEEHVC